MPAWIGATGGRSIAQALPDAYQPAMMVMAAPCAVAAIVTEPFVSDGRSGARTAATMPRLRPAGPGPAAAT
jgi:hypothetical protein